MQAVHEFGHVIAGLVTGADRIIVDLHPLRFSRTHIEPNLQPLIVVLGGPVLGCVMPLALHAVLGGLVPSAARGPVDTARLSDGTRFFAGFCLVANGAYLGIGWIDRVGDAGDLIRLDVPAWLLIVFGIVAFAAGIALWHGLGPRMGLHKLATARWTLLAGLAAAWMGLLAATWMLGLWV